MQVIEPLTEKTWGRIWVVFEVRNGEVSDGGIFFSFHGELLYQEQQENNSKNDICYLEYICRPEQPLSPKLPDKDALSI